MNVSNFSATADIIGRRVRIGWDFVPQPTETLADIPPVTLRRKLRDYAFPPATVPDPYLVYDSTAFPPAPIPGTLTVTDLPSWQTTLNGGVTVFEPISVAASAAGRMVEVLRRTTGTTYDANGTPVSQHVEILDTGQSPGALQASTVYYYQLFGLNLAASGDDAAPYRGSTLVTDTHGMNRMLYESLPDIYRRHDVQTRPVTAGSDTVPEMSTKFGQLRRFVDLFGVTFDSIRGGADGLWTLHDLDRVDGKYLPLLAQWIGWQLSVDSEIPVRRNEIKNAARLYRLVGTLPGIRALVSQYTGWFAQAAEFAQNLTLANQPIQGNLFAITPAAGGASWKGVNDAADALGFGAGHQAASGSATKAATLTGTASEPFALRPGMSLTIAVDRLLPATVRFGTGDFADPANATAAEVAAAIGRGLPELNSAAAAGKVVLTSNTTGVQSQIQVMPETASLVSLQHAPDGRLSWTQDSLGRLRVFYEAWETPSQPESTVSTAAPSTAGAYVQRRLYYKTLLNGTLLDSHPVFPQTVTPQADPAAVVLPDDRIWLAWVDNPQTSGSQLRFTLGASRPLTPARLLGLLRPPFALKDGAVMTLTGSWTGSDQFTVHAANYANIAAATAAEVVAAMNAQLTHAKATAQADGSLRIETVTGGPEARLSVDLRHSTTARALGFDSRNSAGTPGAWDEQIDWSAALNVTSIGAARHAEIAAINDPAGGVRTAWSYHMAGLWRVETAHWADQVLAGTTNGLFLRVGTGAWTAIGGLPSSNVRSLAVDGNGRTWIATAAGVSLRSPAGVLSPLGAVLPSTDVRSVKLARTGLAWIATAAGVAIVALDGSVTTLTAPGTLPSDDVRGIALSNSGSAWIATGAGLALQNRDGTVGGLNTGNGLPSNDVRDVAVGGDGTAYAATGAGLAIITPGGAISVVDATNGLPSADVRAVTAGGDGSIAAATAGGLSVNGPSSGWTTIDTANGLPSNDARSVAFGADGSIWLGTAVGVSIVAGDSTVTNPSLTGGADPAVQSVNTGWSTAFELAADGGANREPALGVDESNRTWAVWSALAAPGDPNDNWSLRYRIYDPTAGTWGAETALTTPPMGGRAADRSPGLLRIAGGMRVFFASDRTGATGLFSVDVMLGGAVSPITTIAIGAALNWAPAAANVGGATWLLYRSDQNIALKQVGSMIPAAVERVPDNGTLRRYAGSLTATPGNLTRNGMRGQFGDLLNYTPNRPDGAGTLSDSELYTRGTLGIYVSKATQGSPLTQQEAARLRTLLASFIPLNMRAVIIIVAPADAEFLYLSGSDLQDGYSDVYPFAETLGAIQESSAAAMPGVTVLHANTAGNVAANPADLTTLARRAFFPPWQ